MTELDKLIAALQERQLSDSGEQTAQKKADELAAGIRSQQHVKFAALDEDMRSFFKKLKSTIENVCRLYPDMVGVDGYELTVKGKKVKGENFDALNCFDVCQDIKKRLVAALKSILMTDFPDEGSIRSLAVCYNTFVAMLLSVKKLEKSAVDMSLEELNANIVKRNSAAKPTALRLTSAAAAENKRRLAEIMPERRLSDDYSSLPSIPVACQFFKLESEEGTTTLVGDILRWDMGKKSVFCIDAEKMTDEAVTERVADVILRFIEAYPVLSVKFAIFSPSSRKEWLSFCGKFDPKSKESPLGGLFFRINVSAPEIITESVEIEQKFKNEVNYTLKDRITNLQDEPITSFNAKNPEISYPIILLVLDDYCGKYYSGVNDVLDKLFNNGLTAGIYSIVIRRADKKAEDSRGAAETPPAEALRVYAQDKEIAGEYNKKKYSLLPSFEEVTNARLQAIEEKLKKNLRTSYIPLKSVLKDRVASEDFSRRLSVPIGRTSSSKVQNIVFTTDDQQAHAVIAGMSGSGKSSLLQDIILCGGWLYSPEQLEIWILDFKDGNGLLQLKELKHVKIMSVKNRPMDALEIMDYIVLEMKRRARLIQARNDICGYNEYAAANGLPLMSRLLIVIDEFTQMPTVCNSRLEIVAKQGRSAGIGLVLSSQTVSKNGNYSDAVKQTGHRFEYTNDNVGSLLNNNATDADRSFLNGAKGNCLYDNGGIVHMRVAYAGKAEEQEAFVREINNKWKKYTRKKLIMTGTPERNIRKTSEFRLNAEELKEKYLTVRKLYLPIGESVWDEVYSCEMERNSHITVMLGDEYRAANIEYSLAAGFCSLGKGAETKVYYFDLATNNDRMTNVMMKVAKKGKKGFMYAKYQDDLNAAVNALYDEFLRRTAAAESNSDIGMPVLVEIHNADNLRVKLETLKSRGKTEDDARKSSSVNLFSGGLDPAALRKNVAMQLGDNDDLPSFSSLREEVNNSPLSAASGKAGKERSYGSAAEDGLTPLDKIKTILSAGNDVRIYALLHFESENAYRNIINLFPNSSEAWFKDFIVIPSVPPAEEAGETYSDMEINAYLKCCGISSDGTNTSLMREDFFFVHAVRNRVLKKIIPYEWSDYE